MLDAVERSTASSPCRADIVQFRVARQAIRMHSEDNLASSGHRVHRLSRCGSFIAGGVWAGNSAGKR